MASNTTKIIPPCTFRILSMILVLVVSMDVRGHGKVHAQFPRPPPFGPPPGLQIGFYQRSCPQAENLIATATKTAVSADPTLAASLLRIQFHDAFVEGVDGSVLIDSTPTNSAEKDAPPNKNSLRGFEVIDAAKTSVENVCPGIVSCADIIALVARDAVSLITNNGQGLWPVTTGRRDGRVSLATEATANLPPPTANYAQLLQSFQNKGLGADDLVILSGAHTIGNTHCVLLQKRLYNFTGIGDSDPSLDPTYVPQLKAKCPPGSIATLIGMDPYTPGQFDNKYFLAVLNNRGLFESDATLLSNPQARNKIRIESVNPNFPFRQDFARSMQKMGSIGALTGSQGEIRRNCHIVN